LAQLETNKQQLQQQQQINGQQNILLENTINNLNNIRANKTKIVKSVLELEDDLAQQEDLLSCKQKEQKKLDDKHTKIQSEIATQQQEKQENKKEIRRVTNQIKQQQSLLQDKQTVLNDYKSKVNRKESELTNIEQKYHSHTQQLTDNRTKLNNINKQTADIDTRKHALVGQIKRMTTNHQKIEDLVQKKKIELETSHKNLIEVTTKYNKQNRTSLVLENAKNSTKSKLDELLINQAENDQKRAVLENRLQIECRKSRHWENNYHIPVSNFEKISLEQRAEEVEDTSKWYKKQFDTYEQFNHDHLSQKRFLYN
jgi:chromosome segregation ATPase